MKKLRDLPIKEADLSRAIRAALKLHGCEVFTTEQGYRKSRGGTRTSPGIPDLIVFQPRRRRWTWAELKVPTGALTGTQRHFKLLADGCGAHHEVWRSVNDCLEWVARA